MIGIHPCQCARTKCSGLATANEDLCDMCEGEGCPIQEDPAKRTWMPAMIQTHAKKAPGVVG